MNRRELSGLLLGGAAFSGCTSPARTMNTIPNAEFPHVPWSRQASLYEVNVRQFTPEGTLSAFESHLPRLQQMGVGILWFMPIQPIGVKHRKGSAGSYYSIRDYTAVNPEFGTLADFRRVVDRAHALGMRVILDWVANHTAWDHHWVHEHPDWYKKDARGEIHAYTYQPTPQSTPEYWTDVVGLDYRQPALWPAMQEAMLFWLREAGIDGFRCDVASLVPTPFWEQTRDVLERVRPVFMLAESDAPELHRRAFDMGYDWALHDRLRDIAAGRQGPAALHEWWARRSARYPLDAYGMNFTSNHDHNSWHGSETESYGPAADVMAVLAATLPGMPLVYGGQEALLDRRIAFFERDPIDWRGFPRQALYTRLLQLKRSHPALANGVHGGALEWVSAPDETLLVFRRVRGASVLTVRANLSDRPRAAGATTLPAWGWTIESV